MVVISDGVKNIDAIYLVRIFEIFLELITVAVPIKVPGHIPQGYSIDFFAGVPGNILIYIIDEI